MKSPLIHLASTVFDSPLAIIPDKLETILGFLGPRITSNPSDLQSLLASHVLRSKQSGVEGEVDKEQLKALLAYDDDEYDEIDEPVEKKPYRITDAGIAILPIRGALIKRGSWMSSLSGCSSYGSIGSAFKAAMTDSAVKAVMMDVDSPGGTTHGCFELSDLIHSMRGDKPVWASANDLAASAAYALASSADRVFVTRTAGVGSIGVFALHCDQSAADEKVGAKYTYVYAGDNKVDGNPHEPLSRSAKKDIQAEVDREYQIFVDTVARNRGSAASRIANTDAKVYFAELSVPLLADEVATFDMAMEKLGNKVNSVGNGKYVGGAEGKDFLSLSPSQPILSGGVGPTGLLSVASATILGDNVPEQQLPTESAVEGETNMAKKKSAEEEMDATTQAAEDMESNTSASGDEGCDEDEGGDAEKKAEAALAALSAGAAAPIDRRAEEIADMCEIAGMANLTGGYIRKGYSVTQVRKFLLDRRSKLSAENPTDSSFSGTAPRKGAAGSSVDDAIAQAKRLAASSGGTLSESKALEQVLASNPDIYESYNEERSHLEKMGSRRDVNNYITTVASRHMRGLGLSTSIDAVPR